MRLLGQALSGCGIPFISAQARHAANGTTGEVACETQEQYVAIAAWAAREGFDITTRVTTEQEMADAKLW